MHRPSMRRLIPAFTLFVAACAPRPQPAPAPTPQPVQPQSAQPRNDLIGMSAAELVHLFGTPALQVREGPGLKLQFRSRACVLDAFLYPTPGRGERVTYVETRLPSGAAANAQSCYSTLKRG